MKARLALRYLYLLSALALAQDNPPNLLTAPPSPQLEAIKKQMQHYQRDVTELAFIVKSDVTVSDSAGKVIEHRQSSHQYTYEAGHGKNKHGQAHRIDKSKISIWDVHPDLGMVLIAYLFLDEHEITDITRQNDLLVVNARTETCSPWEKSGMFDMGLKFKHWCGSSQLRLNADSLVPVYASFSAFQIGPDLHSTDVPSYEYKMTFQRISIPGHGEPFTLPLEATLVVKDKYKTRVIRNTYAPSPEEN
jgi:hypothetical protein